MPRRILLLITDLKIGGTPTVVRELAIRLHADPEFEVHVACLDRWGPVADQLKECGIPVTSLNAIGSLDLSVPKRLIHLIREQNFHTVFSFLVHANAVAALVPLFFSGVRFLQSIQTTQANPRWYWIVQRIAAVNAEKIVVPSRSVAQAAMDWAGVDQRKIVIIPNAVDLGQQPIPRDAHSGKRVGFIGRLDPVKRIGDLVQAISMLDADVSLDIFGEGKERERIEKIVDLLELGDRVKLHGAIDGPAEALAGIDVLVLPSEAEGFGLVLIEAMAAGVPVIGTNVPGIRDVIVDHENGLLASVGDPESLADAIRRVLSDSPFREQIVTGGLRTVKERYDWTAVYSQYRALLVQS